MIMAAEGQALQGFELIGVGAPTIATFDSFYRKLLIVPSLRKKEKVYKEVICQNM